MLNCQEDWTILSVSVNNAVEMQTIFENPMGMVIAGIWGALWGSFFNVVVTRLPASESLVRPASHCRNCNTPIRWFDNIPIVSYLVLGGRCRYCQARFSVQYFLIELLLCGFSLLLYFQIVLIGTGDLGLELAQFVIASLFCGLMIAIAAIDLAIRIIPNAITYPAIPIAMILHVFMKHDRLWDGVLGGVVGYLIIRIFADVYHLITGRFGMGYGDAKLLALIGSLLGWKALLPTLLFASLQGSLIGIPMLLVRRRKIKEDQGPLRFESMPFGPFLSLAGIEVLFLRDLLYLWIYF